MKTFVEVVVIWAETEEGIRKGDRGYIDGYSGNPTKAIVVINNKLVAFDLYELKVVSPCE